MSKVKVAVRVRPFNKREIGMGTKCVIDMEGNQTILDSQSTRKGVKTFAFDHCFWSIDPNNTRKFASQDTVFEALGTDILENSFEGYNACIFAYGQTGSGKSYTMMGTGSDEPATKGLIPRICDGLFAKMKELSDPSLNFKVEVAYMEIYNEKVRDLLSAKGDKAALKVREHITLGPYVEGLSKLAVTSFKDISDLMVEGNKSRTVAATQMNAESSRSHAVFSMVLTQTKFDVAAETGLERVSKISLVDLAGSERAGKTGALGSRLKEGSNINKSLTTLGLVISALADISAGKKPKNAYVPYRDSTLTWLLKDNLGGNSKTVMVATISPASDNFEETLSTLRYADRAKRIVNHAVVNEDANSKIIRELREEVEKLRQMMLLGGGGGGGGVSTAEMESLKEKLQISEGLMAEMTKSWEERLRETERLHRDRQEALEAMGISVQESGIGVQKDKYYLINLNADPSMNELLVCYLKSYTRIGRPGHTVLQDIQLRGLGITNEHCIVEIIDREVFLTPLERAMTRVNGQIITEKTQLKHGSRILFGNNHLYRLSCPRMGGASFDEEEPVMNYEQAMKEISVNELAQDPIYSNMQKKLLEKHQAEKEGALEAQKDMYEKKLAELQTQLDVSSSTSVSPSGSKQSKQVTLEEEWEDQNRERLMNTVLLANQLVREANMLSEALHKDTLFRVTLTIPKSFLSPRQYLSSEEMHTSNEIAIRVIHRQRGTDSVWSLNTLAEKVLTMRDMYQRIEEGSFGLVLDDSIGPDPFFDLEQHALLGVANIFLECLYHGVAHVYDAPIIGPTGKVCGRLKLGLQCLPLIRDSVDDVDNSSSMVTWEAPEEVEDLKPGTHITVRVSVIEASGLPAAYSHNLFCQYKFWGQEEALIIPPLIPSMGGADSVHPPDGVHQFQHHQTFNIEVTEDFLEYINDGALAVEVWGHRRSGFDSVPDAEEDSKRPRSLSERWNDVIKRLELWVEIMELNDQGEYVAVELQPKADIKSGGIFQIRQGQSRRVRVSVVQIPGSGNGPLVCESISSISVGSVYLRNRYDDSLDSYQEVDLERLRTKWSDALSNRREFLDTEVRKIMEKRSRNESDTVKENELIDQWTMLQWERMAVVQPKAGSGVPGAPTNWQLVPGMEAKVPVVFLDLNSGDDDEEERPVTGLVQTGELFGEKPENMIQLPIIKQEDHQLIAVASWDSTVHDTSSLNKVTGANDRVFAIVRVGIKLKNPPGVEIMLRKRICLRVYKRIGIGAAIMKAFTRDYRTTCGIMFEVVTGIPKSEGMEPPPKIPANPSFVELEEDENAVDKFKTGMAAIANVLALDRLKQEVSLKEKLANSGRALKKRFNIQQRLPSPDGATPQSLSRADSGSNIYSRTDSPELEAVSESANDSNPLDNSEQVSFFITPPQDEVFKQEATPTKETPPIQESTPLREGDGESQEEGEKEKEEDEKEKEEEKEEEDSEKVEGTAEDKKEETNEEELKEESSTVDQEPAKPEEVSSTSTEPVTVSPLTDPPETPTEPQTPSTDENSAQPLPSEPVIFVSGEGNGVGEGDRGVGDGCERSESTAGEEEEDRKYEGQSASPVDVHVKPKPKRDNASPTPSDSSENSEASSKQLAPECRLGEKVMVEVANGFKMGTVKFIGDTEFAPGEWIGVALDRPQGKNNGSVKGVTYFKCKDKHGVFVRRDKIIHEPSSSLSASPSPSTRSPKNLASAASPTNPKRRASPNLTKSSIRRSASNRK
ncbi:PREDICTED: kinesin-like protein KIF13B [Amphimedon queenslandica]|uniref:Kinesin-like protein KIF13A n=1 Tax=Amphimedon queenslandica TaxID=400682 RepID=A0A1X7VBQ5_AMPQE|nr:PREDICTED: kinesin-like protein KIF13B [Amphimedon queenslandica]|eukprot:XP_019849545.1 PREDICTED: kinesin-like protein KIF13B [Amphimedon queenslandica]